MEKVNLMDVIGIKYLLGILAISAILIVLHSIGDDFSFESVDLNNDGFISSEEAATYSKLFAKFKEVDINNDDKISVSEFNYFIIK